MLSDEGTSSWLVTSPTRMWRGLLEQNSNPGAWTCRWSIFWRPSCSGAAWLIVELDIVDGTVDVSKYTYINILQSCWCHKHNCYSNISPVTRMTASYVIVRNWSLTGSAIPTSERLLCLTNHWLWIRLKISGIKQHWRWSRLKRQPSIKRKLIELLMCRLEPWSYPSATSSSWK